MSRLCVQHDDISQLAGFTQVSLLNLVYSSACHILMHGACHGCLLSHVLGTSSPSTVTLSIGMFRQVMTEKDIAAALVEVASSTG